MIDRSKKAPEKKLAARPPAVPADMARTTPAPTEGRIKSPISAEQRYRMIAEAAYYRAERRGFRGGDTARDWIEAEAEIDAQILGRG